MLTEDNSIDSSHNGLIVGYLQTYYASPSSNYHTTTQDDEPMPPYNTCSIILINMMQAVYVSQQQLNPEAL